jgi:hypothetical protein
MQTSQVSRRSAGGSEHDRNTVRAPSAWALPRAARTNGVVPLAAIPTTVSFDPTRRESISPIPALTSSSAPSMDLISAGNPPAMMPTTISGGVPNVGGHSAASSTPSRPLVPAPTYSRRPPARKAASIRSTARAISTRARATAVGTVASSAPMRSTISIARAVSMLELSGLRRSVRRRSA